MNRQCNMQDIKPEIVPTPPLEVPVIPRPLLPISEDQSEKQFKIGDHSDAFTGEDKYRSLNKPERDQMN